MKIKKFTVLFHMFLLLISISTKVSSQVNAETKFGLVWYLDKAEVIDSARAQGKMIFALWGREDCAVCNSTKQFLGDSLKDMVNANYLLWHIEYGYDKFNDGNCTYLRYCNEEPSETCDEVNGYFDKLCGDVNFKSLPVICIINPQDTVNKSYDLRYGYRNATALRKMLAPYVANETFKSVKVVGQAYFYGNTLVVESDSNNENIKIYSITGTMVDQFKKTDQTVTKDMSNYPTGILIVSGSSGWYKKILKK